MVVYSSDLLATGAQLRQDRVDAVLVDGAQRVRGNLQLDPAVFAGDPETTLVQVGQEAAAGLVVGVRDVVTRLHALAGNLADAGHNAPRWCLRCTPWPGVRRPRCRKDPEVPDHADGPGKGQA